MPQVVDSPQSRLKLYVVRHVKRANGGYRRDRFIAVVKARSHEEAKKTTCKQFNCRPPLAVVDLSAWLRALSHEAIGYTVWVFEGSGVVQKHITGSETEVFEHFKKLVG